MTDAALRPGQRLGAYEVVGRLGAGGMGAVYEARHLPTGTLRAMKVLPREADAALRERFAREGEALARVDAHPHVARVYELGQADGWAYMVMERVPGEDLGAQLKRTGAWDPERAVDLTLQLCAALEHLHQHGVLHRDLKPANVVLTPDGQPRLIDFGLARVADARSLTGAGELLGTPAYMAPEQANGERVDVAADVYGLGTILYTLLAGRPPFGGQGGPVLAVLHAVLSAPPRPLEGVPQRLAQVVLGALAKSPEQRPPSAAALGERLRAWRVGESAPTRALRRPGPWVALVLVAGALLAWVAPEPPAPAPSTAGGEPSPADDDQVDPAVADYLAVCDDPLAPPERITNRLETAAAELDAGQLEGLRAEKQARLAAALEARRPELEQRLAGLEAGRVCESLAALVLTAPRIELPAPGPELLDAALIARLEQLGEAPRDYAIRALAVFEAQRTRAVGYRRPPPALEAWVGAVAERASDYDLYLAWLALHADERGVGGNHTPLTALRAVVGETTPVGSSRQLAELRREFPSSAALALIELDEALGGHAELPELDDARTWEDLLETGRVAAAAPSELSLYWRSLARVRHVRLLLKRRTVREPLEETLDRARWDAFEDVLASHEADLDAEHFRGVDPALIQETARNITRDLVDRGRAEEVAPVWERAVASLRRVLRECGDTRAMTIRCLGNASRELWLAEHTQAASALATETLEAFRSIADESRIGADQARGGCCVALAVLYAAAGENLEAVARVEDAWLSDVTALESWLPARDTDDEAVIELLRWALTSADRRRDRQAKARRWTVVEGRWEQPPAALAELAPPR